MDRKTRVRIYSILFQTFCVASNMIAILFLGALLFDVLRQGLPGLTPDFLSNYPSRKPENAGILSALVGTLYMMAFTAPLSVVMGVGAAIYLEEYAHDGRFIRFIKLNIQNLAGVPSVIYGILGLTLFVRFFHLGRSLLAGALTMSLLILPIVTIAAQEALRAVPNSLRLGGFGIGMTRWQVVYHPVAMPGMLTGVILALSRAIGETAPLIMIGALTFVAFLPANPLDGFTVLPIQIFNWVSRPQAEFHELAASGIIVLLIALLGMNAGAIYLRGRFHKRMKEWR